MRVLVVDIGGSAVKVRASGEAEARKIESGPEFAPNELVAIVRPLIEELGVGAVALGVPAPVRGGQIVGEAPNLGGGWRGFDFETALGVPVRVENDAAMQALGSYRGGRMLFLGLGTGLGNCLVDDGRVVALELAHLPYREATYEDHLGKRGLEAFGEDRWREAVFEVVPLLAAAVVADDVVIGGGLVHRLPDLPPGCRRGDNNNAYLGGLRMFERPLADVGTPPAKLAAWWRELARSRTRLSELSLRRLLDQPGRVEEWVFHVAGLRVDLCRHLVDRQVLQQLLGLARAAGVEELREAMFAGEAINTTENRAVLHVALRNFADRPMRVAGEDVMPAVRATRARVGELAERIRSGAWRGATGAAIRDVVNIGIGGSDLGPAMVVEALPHLASNGRRLHFVSNVDGAHLAETLRHLDPATTLFIVASKTFTTQETLANARSARRWLVAALGEGAVAAHFVAVSTNAEEVARFGIDTANMVGFWDWVGGRYSLWSAIGLPIAIAVGAAGFERLLRGAFEVDEHFRSAPLESNVPVLLALLGVWYRNFCGFQAHAVLPYDQRLRRLPAYLQQADMESNGKGVDREGRPLGIDTGPIVFGEPGTNGQHAFYQLLHQGTTPVPMDLLGALETDHPIGDPPGLHHQMLLANLIAQAEAFAIGRTAEEAAAELAAQGKDAAATRRLLPHKVFPGNRPSTVITYRRLDPFTLGALIALYEHKIFAMGAVWQLDSFDQWGVELGKTLANRILPELAGGSGGHHDAATSALIDEVRRRGGEAAAE